MQAIENGYKSLSLLVFLNWDRIASLSAIAVGLLVGSWLGSMISNL